MKQKHKVVQCPNCSTYTQVPMKEEHHSCPHCNAKVAIHNLKGQLVNTPQEAQRLIQYYQSILQRKVKPLQPVSPRTPVEQVLHILRCSKLDGPQWLPIHEVFQQSLDAGFLPKEVQKAIDLLNAAGFLEKREDAIRVVPLN